MGDVGNINDNGERDRSVENLGSITPAAGG